MAHDSKVYFTLCLTYSYVLNFDYKIRRNLGVFKTISALKQLKSAPLSEGSWISAYSWAAMVTSTDTPGSIAMLVICLTTSEVA